MGMEHMTIHLSLPGTIRQRRGNGGCFHPQPMGDRIRGIADGKSCWKIWVLFELSCFWPKLQVHQGLWLDHYTFYGFINRTEKAHLVSQIPISDGSIMLTHTEKIITLMCHGCIRKLILVKLIFGNYYSCIQKLIFGNLSSTTNSVVFGK